MAEKELRLEPFTPEEESFLRSIVIRQSITEEAQMCIMVTVEHWTGWYNDLFPWEDNSPVSFRRRVSCTSPPGHPPPSL
jgi:hypothetical protein